MLEAKAPNPQMQLTGAHVSKEFAFVRPCASGYVHHHHAGRKRSHYGVTTFVFQGETVYGPRIRENLVQIDQLFSQLLCSQK